MIQSTTMKTVYLAFCTWIIILGHERFNFLIFAEFLENLGTISVYMDFILVSALVSIKTSPVEQNRIWRALQRLSIGFSSKYFYLLYASPLVSHLYNTMSLIHELFVRKSSQEQL